MKTIRPIRSISLITISAFLLGTFTACQMPASLASPSPTPSATASHTASPSATPRPTATATFTPTITSSPTRTPDMTVTAQYNSIYTTVQQYHEEGDLPSEDGMFLHVDDYSGTWAQISWYTWRNTKYSPKDFVLKSHMAWESASKTPNPSGCGINFHIQPTYEHYVVFVLSSGYIQFGIVTDTFHDQGQHYYGPPTNKGEVDIAMIVLGTKVSVFINNKYIASFTTLMDILQDGALGNAILSGTNAGYGTRCEITQSNLWVIEP